MTGLIRALSYAACVLLLPVVAVQAQKQQAISPRILSAKTAYFDYQSVPPKVGEKALDRLKKWGRFQIVQDRKQADLIILLSTDTPGGDIIFADGRTGTVDKTGNIAVNGIPGLNKEAAPVRYAYLTVVDAKTEEKLWSDYHQWGGLLTGFNSAGETLVTNLEKAVKKKDHHP